MSDTPRVCIDRVLPKDLMRFQPTNGDGPRLSAVSLLGKTWMNGSTLQVRFMGGSEAERAVAREQAGWWSEVANLQFLFNDAPGAEIRVSFDSQDGAWSYPGTDCRHIPLNQATMNLGFMDGGTAAHEFGHAIGLVHEHQNPENGIQWNEPVVIAALGGAPNYWDEETVRHNVLRKYSADQVNGTAFDPQSIMLYYFPASWTLNGVSTKSNEVLSQMDKAFVAGAQMYPKEPVNARSLKVNHSKRTVCALRKFGAEDHFRFRAKYDGTYMVDAMGGDVVLKLFGPNSQTALIAEDGLYTEAAVITASLIAGDYFVQVRHDNRTGGVGKYSIQVVRAG